MPRRGHALTVLAVGLFVATMLAVQDGRAAGDIAAGRQKALMCQTCHGLDGKAKIPEAPSLAGQSAVYLTKALNDYRSGARKNDMMSLVQQDAERQGRGRSRCLLLSDRGHGFVAAEITTQRRRLPMFRKRAVRDIRRGRIRPGLRQPSSFSDAPISSLLMARSLERFQF
jgi:cytochrome c553